MSRGLRRTIQRGDLDISLAQRRILLTRDRALLKRRIITHGVFVHSVDPEEQTLEVMRRLDPSGRLAPFTRCVRCNGELTAVTKKGVDAVRLGMNPSKPALIRSSEQ